MNDSGFRYSPIDQCLQEYPVYRVYSRHSSSWILNAHRRFTNVKGAFCAQRTRYIFIDFPTFLSLCRVLRRTILQSDCRRLSFSWKNVQGDLRRAVCGTDFALSPRILGARFATRRRNKAQQREGLDKLFLT